MKKYIKYIILLLLTLLIGMIGIYLYHDNLKEKEKNKKVYVNQEINEQIGKGEEIIVENSNETALTNSWVTSPKEETNSSQEILESSSTDTNTNTEIKNIEDSLTIDSSKEVTAPNTKPEENYFIIDIIKNSLVETISSTQEEKKEERLEITEEINLPSQENIKTPAINAESTASNNSNTNNATSNNSTANTTSSNQTSTTNSNTTTVNTSNNEIDSTPNNKLVTSKYVKLDKTILYGEYQKSYPLKATLSGIEGTII